MNLSSLRAAGDALLAFLYPNVCQLCNERVATKAEGYVCRPCRSGVQPIVPPFCSRCGRPVEGAITNAFTCGQCDEAEEELQFEFARAAVAFSGPVLEAIHRLKYNRALWFKPFLASLLIEAAAPLLTTADAKWTALVPVPLWWLKQKEREFNQAEILAHALGKATGLLVDTKLLKRIQPTESQTLLSREKRAENVRRAFALNHRRFADAAKPLAGNSYVLVDDVFTTGATTNACARVLKRAGAERVIVWTVARGV